MIALITKFFLLMLDLISGLFCTEVPNQHERLLFKKTDSILIRTSEKQTFHQKNSESSASIL